MQAQISPDDTVETFTDTQPASRTPPGLRLPQGLPTPRSVDGMETSVVTNSRQVKSNMDHGNSGSTSAPAESLRATTTTPPLSDKPDTGYLFMATRVCSFNLCTYQSIHTTVCEPSGDEHTGISHRTIRRPLPVHPVQPYPTIHCSTGNTAPHDNGTGVSIYGVAGTSS